MTARACGAALLASLALGAHAQAPLQVFPTNFDLHAGEDFVVQFNGNTGSSPALVEATSSSVSGQTLTLHVDVREFGFAVGAVYRAGVVANVPFAGIYSVTLERGSGVGVQRAENVTTLTVGSARAPASPQFRNLSGLWWNPNESGTGASITQADSGQLFLVWYAHRPIIGSGGLEGTRTQPYWLAMSTGKWISPTEYRGVLHETRAAGLNNAYVASEARTFPKGMATLRFLAPDRVELMAEADLDSTSDGFFLSVATVRRTLTLQRFLF